MYLLGVALSFILFSRMAGAHKVIPVDNDAMNTAILCLLISLLWPLSVPIILSYWHISKNN